MSVALPARAALALLLALSVGLKVAHGFRVLPEQAAAATEVTVASFLRRHGFRVVVNAPVVQAAAQGCDLLVVVAAPQGWHRDVVHRIARPGDRVFFVVNGQIFADQPLWRTWTYYYWRRANQLIGRRLPPHPVLGFVASSVCDLHSLPWMEIAAAPQPPPKTTYATATA